LLVGFDQLAHRLALGAAPVFKDHGRHYTRAPRDTRFRF
jgi:hypothetical protein